MDLLKKTKELCKKNNILPIRSKGQNFLINEEIYNNIINSADLNDNDIVLEVGPGLGFLTEKLAKRAKQVIAVELDDKLAGLLKESLQEKKIEKVEVINANILNLRIMNNELRIMRGSKENVNSTSHDLLFMLHNSNYKIVANLPYNITSVFLRKFLTSNFKPELMVLMLQKEVAERIVAKPSKMSLLSVSVQFYAEAEIIKNVLRENFWPQPEVDSAIIKITDKKKRKERVELDEKEFFRFVKFGFSSKRKMLKNNLAAGYHISQKEVEEFIEKNDFDTKIRAQELSVNDWIKLFGDFSRNML